TQMEFCVSNYLSRGTVAPFNKLTGQFDDVINEVRGCPVIVAEESDFLPVTENGGNGKQIFERINSLAQQETFVIVRGYFQTSGKDETNTNQWSYYKLAIAEQEAYRLYDLKRNYHYHIVVKGVGSEGHKTFQEAMQGEPSNNINVTITSNLITRVTDGVNVLELETALLSAVNINEKITVGYKYFDLSTGAVNNSEVVVTLGQDEEKKAIADYTYSDGNIVITTANSLPENDIAVAYMYVSAGKLSRRLTVRLREPMRFSAIEVIPSNTGGLIANPGNEIGSKLSVSFKFPHDIAPSLFPIPVYINAPFMSPDPELVTDRDPIYIEVTEDKTVRYVYMAEYRVDENNQPLAHTLYLMTAIPNIRNKKITVTADLFNPFVIDVNPL
ncbi:MAG: hypothetical protein ACRDD0_07070, partial [Bacteroidales bacterium]